MCFGVDRSEICEKYIEVLRNIMAVELSSPPSLVR